MREDKTQGLTCPNCNGIVPVPEGVRMVQCPYCDMRSLVSGERGVRRWQVARQVDRPGAMRTVEGFWSGMNRARGLKRKAKVEEVFLVYLPYWRVQAWVAGWMLGRVKAGDDDTRPVEIEVMEQMAWNDAATDVSEFGVHRVTVAHDDLLPYDDDLLHREGMVFAPSESRTEALAEAEHHFIYRAQRTRTLASKYDEKFHILRPQLAQVYYPLWVARYEFRRRHYQVVVDGVRGKVLYGKAPGNIFYRAAALVGGMALGNLVLVNGTIIALLLISQSSNDDTPLWLLLIPLVIGLVLISTGYRTFRYGEEVEERAEESEKAAVSGDDKPKWLTTGVDFVDELME